MTMTLLLKCGQLEETKSFYSEVLGFDVRDTAGQTCTAAKAGGSIIFTESDLWQGPPHCTGTIYFFVPDVDAYYEAVKHRANVRWPLQQMSYGTREFAVQECNGHTLAFAQRI
jgi:predicted enzyme related to lactoylglutathione lyase